jgi:heme-degrading monooxygenase HmoA
MTQVVFFDVLPREGHTDAYFSMAANLKPIAMNNPGFISVERFENLGSPGWYLSFSQWRDEEALGQWRCQPDHHGAQVCGRNLVLADYRLRVAAEQQANQLGKSAVGERTAILIGDFAAIEVHVDALLAQIHDFAESLQLFKAILEPKRGIALLNHFSGVLPALTNDQHDPFAVRYFEVCRDYGMFDRVQAPQQFA